jgi:hypothetical protein
MGINSQVANSLEFSKSPRNKEVLVKPRQLTNVQGMLYADYIEYIFN